MKNDSKFFVAGWFCDQANNVLTVVDKHKEKTNIKAPGGRSDRYAFYDQIYLEILEEMLTKALFLKKEREQILEREDGLEKTPEERVLIIEYLEEPGYYVHSYASEPYTDFVKNHDTGKMDYPRTFFDITKLIERNPDPDANELHVVKEIVPLPGFKSSDRDVKKTRNIVLLKEIYDTVLWSHQEPCREWIMKRAMEDRNFGHIAAKLPEKINRR